MVVDDEATNRLILNALLQQLNFDVVEAEDGEMAIKCFEKQRPDIIFMDIMMPGIDGYEAIRVIKNKYPDIFIPIIVLTALNDEQTLSRAITEGGDDVLTKPFDAFMLKSKIYSMMRIRDLHQRISRLYTQMKYEEEIAETVFTRAVTASNVEPESIRILSRPACTFSGDMVLTDYGPGGDFHMLLGDFTGHGLSAAIGALPTAEVFRAMVNKGFNADNILTAINTKLHTMLPVDVFMAACYIQVSADLNHIEIYNCGLPEVLIWDDNVPGKIRGRLSSKFFPLGIQSSFPSQDILHRAELYRGNRIFIYSDGVIESRNIHGEQFGQARLEACLSMTVCDNSSHDTIIENISQFCGNTEQHDDITLVEIIYEDGLVGIPADDHTIKVTDSNRVASKDSSAETDNINKFHFNVTFSGKRLQQNEILPLLMSNLQEMGLPKSALTNIYTVLTELITNALDHGVLKLGSEFKSTPEGFTEYFSERESRLDVLQRGYVSVSIDSEIKQTTGKLIFNIEDSGEGFDLTNLNQNIRALNLYHGRGIPLVQSLCSAVEYSIPGNKVRAVYDYTI